MFLKFTIRIVLFSAGSIPAILAIFFTILDNTKQYLLLQYFTIPNNIFQFQTIPKKLGARPYCLELTIRCGDVTLQSLTLHCFGAWSLTSHSKYFALYESQHMGHFLFAYLPTSRCYYPLLEASSFQDLASDPLWLFWLLSYGRSKYLTHFFSGAVVKPTTG